MKVTIKGLVHEVENGWGDKEYRLFKYDQSDKYTAAVIGPAEFEFEVPDDFNPIPAKLAAIEQAKQKARAEYMAKVEELNEQASKLTALKFDGAEVQA